ncbi:hypothetical protein ACMFMG_007059 [Clarireedia jacksonii]
MLDSEAEDLRTGQDCIGLYTGETSIEELLKITTRRGKVTMESDALHALHTLHTQHAFVSPVPPYMSTEYVGVWRRRNASRPCRKLRIPCSALLPFTLHRLPFTVRHAYFAFICQKRPSKKKRKEKVQVKGLRAFNVYYP